MASPVPSRAPVPPPAPIPFLKPVAPALAPAVSADIATLPVPLSTMAEVWPETLRVEIVQSNLAGAQVALPVHLVEPALKRGRVVFPWHQLRAWIRPLPPGPSIHDSMELELPLKVLAPLFLPRQSPEAKQRLKASLPPSSVPNLFFGFPQPQPEEMAPPLNAPDIVPLVKPADAKIAETDYYVWGDGNEAPRVDETDYKRPQTPATDFTSRRAMPNEIIGRAMTLPGVIGAIIALPDGLKVAHQLPPELNADTVAAFLPQLFSRVSQCSKELRMGELNNLNFTIGNVPWKIFRVNAVYFATFGRAGEPLPTAQLAQLAAELDRKK
jgi:predicted regulator of Ras-like GTPase activity (Roadblock/LC7/MglB family)